MLQQQFDDNHDNHNYERDEYIQYYKRLLTVYRGASTALPFGNALSHVRLVRSFGHSSVALYPQPLSAVKRVVLRYN